jgi:predicted RNA-binding Zn ribbon-like protein
MLDTKKFYLVGNNLAIDLINTEIAVDGKPKDLLTSFEDLIAWSVATGLLSAREAKAGFAAWQSQAGEVLSEAVAFRSTLREMFADIGEGRAIRKGHVSAINERLKANRGYSELMRTDDGYEKLFRADFSDLRQILIAVAESAADLLAFGELTLVRKCENPDCVLFFYDTTKNHKRRWCSMAACGNRAKVRAFYERKKRLRAQNN